MVGRHIIFLDSSGGAGDMCVNIVPLDTYTCNNSNTCAFRYVNTMLRYLVDEAKDKRHHVKSGLGIAQWTKLHDLAKVQTN